MKKLYEIEYEYLTAYNNALDYAEMGCSLREMVEEIGFNNIVILNPNEEDTDKYDLFDIYYDSDNYEKLSDEAKSCRFVLSSTYEDSEGLTCANVEIENKDDWKYFIGKESDE